MYPSQTTTRVLNDNNRGSKNNLVLICEKLDFCIYITDHKHMRIFGEVHLSTYTCTFSHIR